MMVVEPVPATQRALVERENRRSLITYDPNILSLRRMSPPSPVRGAARTCRAVVNSTEVSHPLRASRATFKGHRQRAGKALAAARGGMRFARPSRRSPLGAVGGAPRRSLD
jgi:hypothetical protein